MKMIEAVIRPFKLDVAVPDRLCDHVVGIITRAARTGRGAPA
jgi:nitrogen regulatory protein PII